MEPARNFYPDTRIKLGVLTNLDEAFRNYGVGWNKQGLFNLLSDAARYDVPFSEAYEFTRIFNWNPHHANLPAEKPYNSGAHSIIRDGDGSVSFPALEQITSRFSGEDDLMTGLYQHDIDVVLTYYCQPFSPHSSPMLSREYNLRIVDLNPLNFLDFKNLYHPDKENSECSPEEAEKGIFYSALARFLSHEGFMGSMRLGRENRLQQRLEVTSTIDDIHNYLGIQQ